MPMTDTLLSIFMTLSFAALAVASAKLAVIRIPAKNRRCNKHGQQGYGAGR